MAHSAPTRISLWHSCTITITGCYSSHCHVVGRYLTDGYDGGETGFVHLGVRAWGRPSARAGGEGRRDRATLHTVAGPTHTAQLLTRTV